MENELTSIIGQSLFPQEAEEKTQDAQDAASKLLTPTFASLDAAQKNASDISCLVDHVVELSGHEQYVQANNAIMTDPSLSIDEKLKLKRENDEWQDRRTAKSAEVVANLQDVNTKNTSAATNSWIGPVLIALGIGAGVFFGFTKPGRLFARAALQAAQQLSA